MRATDGVIDRALAEDIGSGDLTTDAIVPAALRGSAAVVVRERGVVCGLDEALAVLQRLDPTATMERLVEDGDQVADPPQTAARIHASLRAILTAERTALNLLQRMSGIATETRRYAEAIAGTGVVLLDTRKTAPGMRTLDKRAVACGGGTNHRLALDDRILIKDNHLRVAGSIAMAVELAQETGAAVEVECETLDQVQKALDAGADSILLDNMTPATLAQAVALTAGRASLEASGGVTLDNVRAIAETGVDSISIGALTHSVRSLDFSMEVS